MTPEAVMVSKPNINLDVFLQGASNGLGYSVGRGIDTLPAGRLSDPEKFIVALALFSDSENHKPIEALRAAHHELFFLHYGFLIYCDELVAEKIREWTRLDVTTNVSVNGERLVYAAGSLFDWYNATRECCSKKADFQLRLLFDKIVLEFERAGLSNVWFDVTRKSLPDKTFLLEDKR